MTEDFRVETSGVLARELLITRRFAVDLEAKSLRSGVAQPNVAAYEVGRRNPEAATVERLRSAMSPLPHEALERDRDELVALATEYGPWSR